MNTARQSGRGGFTLIEMMAVLVIISILAVFVLRAVTGGKVVVERKATKAFLHQLSAMIDEYEGVTGDYPPSTFPAEMDPKPTRINMGAEMLVISLFPREGEFQSPELDDGRLGNTDADTTRKSLTSFTSAQAFEILDNWNNPIAYIHRRDYDASTTYITENPETGEEIEGRVKGRFNPKTEDPYRKGTFQLISAGPDGTFGNRDDITNFE